jgi:L-amino acid N-acyltransferase YncA
VTSFRNVINRSERRRERERGKGFQSHIYNAQALHEYFTISSVWVIYEA